MLGVPVYLVQRAKLRAAAHEPSTGTSILVDATPEPDVTVPASRLGVRLGSRDSCEQAVVHRPGLELSRLTPDERR